MQQTPAVRFMLWKWNITACQKVKECCKMWQNVALWKVQNESSNQKSNQVDPFAHERNILSACMLRLNLKIMRLMWAWKLLTCPATQMGRPYRDSLFKLVLPRRCHAWMRRCEPLQEAIPLPEHSSKTKSALGAHSASAKGFFRLLGEVKNFKKKICKYQKPRMVLCYLHRKHEKCINNTNYRNNLYVFI